MDEPSRATLAGRIDYLFATIRPSARREFTLAEVVDGIRESGADPMSVGYLHQLRRGKKDNPSKKHLEALAAFFGVAPSYFFDEAAAQQIKDELALLAAFRNSTVRALALRANDLSPSSLRAVIELIDHVLDIEHPKPADPDETSADGPPSRPPPHAP